jgi:hypothetical protein
MDNELQNKIGVARNEEKKVNDCILTEENNKKNLLGLPRDNGFRCTRPCHQNSNNTIVA